ncbi:MAG: Na+/H+ antiporter NhaA [Gammaproteobacteria bacterium]
MAIETAASVLLLTATVVALVVSNSPWAEHFQQVWNTRIGFQIGAWDFDRSAQAWINDGLMTFFFFLVSLELKRELVLGELRNPRTAALSIAAAIGGMVVPAAVYLAIESGQPGQHGWGTVMATDTAFVIGCLAALGKRIPQSLRLFMLSLAIIDDIGAIVVVALGYSHAIAWPALALAALGIALVYLMARLGFRGFPVFFLVGGGIWMAIDASGIHATVTGVILGLMTPARRWVSDDRLYAILAQVVAHPDSQEGAGDTRNRGTLQLAEVAARESLSPVERLEIGLHPWVGFVIMPLFALANAGVTLSAEGLDVSIVVAVVLGFAVGKPLGVLSLAWLAVRVGIATRPPELGWSALAGGGLLAGIGFTMAMFIANLAFSDALIGSAKIGILVASILSALGGLMLLAKLGAQAPQRDR